MITWEVEEFFKTGGALEADAPSYVVRQADHELRQAVLFGQYCNILTARQMGKSSLMVRTVSYLQNRGTRTVVIDLTAVGVTVSASEWYFGLLSQFKRQLGLRLDEIAWWTERQQLGPVQRFSDFLRQVVLVEIAEPIVVFIDEIDSTLSLLFTDDFFAAIRAAFNARAGDPVYNRLTFVLLGVARPADLIKTRTRTPYNIGISIDLQDFSLQEAQSLLVGLEAAYGPEAEAILGRILYWTDGHPYLTQKICAELVTEDGRWTETRVDSLVERLFLAEEGRKETNLQFIRDRVRASRERAGMLRVYRRVRAGKRVVDEERSAVKSQLKLTGLVKTRSGNELVARNRIYSQVFDLVWVRENMPVSRTQWLAIVTTGIAVLTAVIVGYLYYSNQTRTDEVRASLFTSGFEEATSPEVRLNNLAGLFRLPGYEDEARDLFFGLNAAKRLALFVGLNDPQQVGVDLLTVVEGVYQDQRLQDNQEHNELLQRITEVLHQVEGETVPGAQVRAREIDHWLAGRNANDLETALDEYTLALGLNERNPAVLFDRGKAYAGLNQYDNALADLQAAWILDQGRETEIEQIINGDPDLFTYLGQNRPPYEIAALFPTLTPIPTLTPTSTATMAPTPTTPLPTDASIPTVTPPPPAPTDTLTPTVTPPPPAPTDTLTPTPTTPKPTTPPPPPLLTGKLAVPIDNNANGYHVWVYQLPDGERRCSIQNARQPNFNLDGATLLVNGEGRGVPEKVLEYRADCSGGREVSSFSNDAYPFYYPTRGSVSIIVNSDNLFGIGWQLFIQRDFSSDPNHPREGLTVGGQEVIRDNNTPLFPVWAADDTIIFRGCNYWQQPNSGQICGLWKKAQDDSAPLSHVDDDKAIPTDARGDRLVYMSSKEGDWDVYVASSISGGEGINITEDPTSATRVDDGLGTISPDGNWVAFVSTRGGQWGVWVTPIDGGDAQHLSFIEISAWPGDWIRERLSWGP